MRNSIDVPLFLNSDADVHCAQAVLQMILKYYFPNRNYDLEYLDKMTHHLEGGWTWDTPIFQYLWMLGFDIKVYSNFNYHIFAEHGEDYLRKIWTQDQINVEHLNADINFERQLARDFWLSNRNRLAFFNHSASRSEIMDLFDNNFLVVTTVNCYALEGQEGDSAHFILITGYNSKYILYNDVDYDNGKNLQISWVKLFRSQVQFPVTFAVKIGNMLHYSDEENSIL